MRRLTSLQASLEDVYIPLDMREVPSMEEAIVLVSEIGDISEGIRSDLAEVHRIDELAQALQDVANVASGITEATPRECALMEIVGDVAVAGTPIDPAAVIPAMESYIGKTISVESIRDKARTIWEHIQRIIKQIWDSIRGFIKRFIGIRAVQKHHILKLRKKLQDLGDAAPVKEEFELGIYGKVLSIKRALESADVRYIDSGEKLVTELKKYIGASTELYQQYAPRLEKAGELVLTAINTFDPTHPTDAANGLLIGLQRNGVSHKFNSIKVDAKSSEHDRYGQETEHYETMLGGASITTSKVSMSDAKSGDILVSLAKEGKQFVRYGSTANADMHAPPRTMKVFTKKEMEAILKGMEDLMEIADHFETTNCRRMEKLQDNIEKAAARMTERFRDTNTAHATGKSDETSDPEGANVVKYYRGIVEFDVHYSEWFIGAFMHAMRDSVRIISELGTLLDKSVACYTEKK